MDLLNHRVLWVPVILVILVSVIPLRAGAQCDPAGTKAKLYTFSAHSGSVEPSDNNASSAGGKKHRTYTLANDTDVVVRLKDINPFAFKCSVSTSSKAFTETAVASFLGTLGGAANITGAGATNPGSSVPPTKSTTEFLALVQKLPKAEADRANKAADATDACIKKYNDGPHARIVDLEASRKAINSALQSTQQQQQVVIDAFNKGLTGQDQNNDPGLRGASACSDVVSRAKKLRDESIPAIQPVSDLPLDQAIDRVAFEAQALLGHLTDNTADCKQQLQNTIDEDTAFLQALVVGSSSSPSAVTKWRTQLQALTTVNANIRKAQDSIAAVLGNRQNFAIDTEIHGNQQTITVTMGCSAVAMQSISADSSSSPPAAPPAATATAPKQAASGDTSNSVAYDFKFGVGPRFVLAGGLVVSPLRQVTFNTTATPGGSGATANTIIQQQNSSTRILPIAMLHGRFWDQLPADKFKNVRWVPNYLSVGVTAKASDNKGTNIEYLFGPSWAFADRQLFFTAGAYAGQQQRLANSLTVGSTTSLSGANLPITQTTIWKAGFAITWAPAGK